MIQLLDAYSVEDIFLGNPGSERAAAAALFGARNSSIRDIYDVAEKVAEISSKVEKLQTSVQDLRTEIADLPTKQQFQDLDTKIQDLRAETNQQFQDLRAETNKQFQDLDTKVQDLRAETNKQFQDLRSQIADLPKKNDLQDTLKSISEMLLRREELGKMPTLDVDGDRCELPSYPRLLY
jgi:chromosome segregation ATPase